MAQPYEIFKKHNLSSIESRKLYVKQHPELGIKENEVGTADANIRLANALEVGANMSGKIKVAPQYRNQFLFEDEVTTRGNRVYVTPKQVPDADLATSDTAYAYAGQLPTVSVTAERKQVSSAGVTEWANEAAKDPSVLFNPNYKKYREALPLSAWVKIMEKHPDWWTKETSKYIPENVQSALFNRGIRQATDKAASTIAPLVIGFTNPLAAVAGVVGATAVDEGISAASGGKYQGFADAMELTVGRPISDLFISPDLNNSHFWNVVHPGAIAMGLGATKAVPTAELSYTPLQRVRNPKTGRIELVETPDVTWRFGGDALKGLAELYGSTDRVVLLTPSVVKGKSTTGFNNGKVSGGSFRWNNTTRYRSGHGNGQPHGRGQQTFDVQWTPQEVPYREYSGSFNLPNRVFWPTYFTSPTQLQGTTVSPAPTKLITIPQMYTWQTVTRRAGSPEFNQWFRELYQQNPGGVASGPWGDIRLNLAPRRFNIEGGQYAPGFYTSGAATSVEGLPLIILDPYSNPPYNRAGITEAGATTTPITTGATVSFKQGGLLMRKGGRIVEVPYYQEGTNRGGITYDYGYGTLTEAPKRGLVERGLGWLNNNIVARVSPSAARQNEGAYQTIVNNPFVNTFVPAKAMDEGDTEAALLGMITHTGGMPRFAKSVETMNHHEIKSAAKELEQQIAKATKAGDTNLVKTLKELQAKVAARWNKMFRLGADGSLNVRERTIRKRPKPYQKLPYSLDDFDLYPVDENWYWGAADRPVFRKNGGKV